MQKTCYLTHSLMSSNLFKFHIYFYEQKLFQMTCKCLLTHKITAECRKRTVSNSTQIRSPDHTGKRARIKLWNCIQVISPMHNIQRVVGAVVGATISLLIVYSVGMQCNCLWLCNHGRADVQIYRSSCWHSTLPNCSTRLERCQIYFKIK